jgi:hypothetical protein
VTIKAIETVYRGYRFRSRLEARYAVFFDVLGVRWEYEPQGFDLGPAGWYLPDFWLPDLRMWAEVKAEALDEQELAKARALANGTNAEVLQLVGTPTFKVYWATCPDGQEHENDRGEFDYILDDQYIHSEKRWFGSPGVGDGEDLGRTYSMSERTKAAYDAARSARFEYGEGGGIEWSSASGRAVRRLR